MPRKKSRASGKPTRTTSHRGLTFRHLHRKLQAPAKDLRVSAGATAALQEELVGIAEHLIRKIRTRVKDDDRFTVLVGDVEAVFEDFIRPRKLAAWVSTHLQKLSTQIQTEAETSSAEFEEDD